MSLHWRGFHKVKHFKDQNQFSEHLHNSLMITKDSQVNEKILNLTLEIIFLLTGEDFVFVKNAHSHEADSSSPCVSEGLFTVQNPTMELSHDSQIHEKNSDRILDLTNKNMGCENLHPEMLKQSDPELTVIDHRDHTDTHADESSNRNTPERHPIHPYSQDRTEEECRVTQDYQMEADRTFPQRCKEEEIPTEIQTGFDDSYLSDNDQRDSEEKRVHPRICADESGNRNTPERRPISPYSQDRIEEEKRITQDCKMEPDDVIFSQQCKEEEIPTDTSTAPEGILSNRFIQKDDGPNVVTNISSSETLRNSLTIIYTDITSHNDIKHTDSQMEHTGTEYSSIFIHKNSKRKTHVPKIQENSSKKKSKYRDYDGNTPDEVDFGSHQRIQDEMSNTPKRQSCFADNSDLTSHQNDVEHQARHRQKKLCQCTECGKIHTGDKPLVCPVCGKSFTKTSNLVAHQRIHTGEKPFVCSICGKCFTATSSLVVHQRIHTGEKPFQCSDCGKCFSFRSGFITHQRTHTGEKPHVCSKCGKSFIQIGHLARHQKIHTSEKKH